jgi:hypothetical protein
VVEGVGIVVLQFQEDLVEEVELVAMLHLDQLLEHQEILQALLLLKETMEVALALILMQVHLQVVEVVDLVEQEVLVLLVLEELAVMAQHHL